MRRTTSDKDWIEENETFVGVNLGFDFCAEHEWGIKTLKRKLGIVGTSDSKNFGLKGRLIKNAECLRLEKFGNRTILTSYEDGGYKRHVEDYFMKNGTELQAVWDEEAFAVQTLSEDEGKRLQEIHDEAKKGNVALFLGGRSLLGNSGLVLVIVDRVSEEAKKIAYETDEESHRLKEEDEKIGLQAYLGSKDKRFYACSPQFHNGHRDSETKYPLVYWLNPMEQQEHNYGWFTVEELRAWADGKPNPIDMEKGK